MEQTYTQIFQNFNTPLMVINVENRCVINYNKKCEEFFGFAVEHNNSISMNEFFSPEHTEEIIYYVNSLEEELPLFNKITVSDGYGKLYILTQVQKLPKNNALLEFSFHDIASGDFYGMLTNSVDLICSISTEGKFLFVNDAGLEELGYKREEIRNLCYWDLVDPLDLALTKNKLDLKKRGIEEMSEPYELRLIRKDTSRLWVEIKSRAHRVDGKIQRIDGIARNISKRKEAEEKLESSQANLNALFNNTVHAFLLIDSDFNIEAFNRVALSYGRLFYKQEMKAGSSMIDFIDEYDKIRFIEAFQRAFEGESIVLEKCFGTKGRYEYWSEINIAPVFSLKKHVIGASISILDISNRKLQDRIQHALYEISHASLKINDLSELFSIIHSALSSIVPSKNLCIALINEGENEIEFPYFYDEYRENFRNSENFSSVCEKGVIEKIISRGQAVLLKKHELLAIIDPDHFPPERKIPIEVLGIPLTTADKKTIGALLIKNYSEDINFLEEDLKILSFIAHQAAMAIERKLFENKLQEDIKFRESLLNTIPNPILFKDFEGRYRELNNAFARIILGMDKKNVIGKTVFEMAEVIPPELASIYYEQDLQAINAGGTQVFESKVRCADGIIRDFIIHKTAHKGSKNEPLGLIIALVDISERIKFEKALQDSIERYRSISELISDFAFSAQIKIGGGLVFDWITDAFSRITGFSVNELKILEENNTLAHPDDRYLAHEQYKSLLSGRQTVQEFRIVTKNGEVRWMRRYFKPIFDKSNFRRVIGLIGAGQDITDQKNTEEALSKSIENNLSLIMILREGVLMVNADGFIMSANPSAEIILGLDEEHLEGSTLGDLFRNSITENNTLCSKDKFPIMDTLRTGKPEYNSIIGIRRPDKSLVWISMNSSPLFQPGDIRISGAVTSFLEVDKPQKDFVLV